MVMEVEETGLLKRYTPQSMRRRRLVQILVVVLVALAAGGFKLSVRADVYFLLRGGVRRYELGGVRT